MLIFVVVRLLAVGILVFPGLLAYSQQQRYAVMNNGVQCGVVDVSIERLDNGYLEYKVRETRRAVGYDGNVQEFVSISSCLADASLRPVSVETVTRNGGSSVTIKGSVVDGTMFVTKELGQGRVERWREDCTGAVIDVMLPELAARSLPEVPTRVYRLRDHRAVPAELRVEASDEEQVIVKLAEKEFWLVSRDNILQRYSLPALAISWERVETRSITASPCSIAAGVEWDAGPVSLASSTDNIRLLRAIIKLHGNVGAVLAPEDARQRMDPDSAADGNFIRVTVEQHQRDPGSVDLPVFDRTLLQYVKGDSMIALDNQPVRSRATSLKSWERKSDAVVRSLLSMIKWDFTEDLFVPLVPASGIAEVPRGASIHASLLFVAIARAVGLPARFVFGAVPVDGRWRTKVWAEVWSEDWSSVDPLTGSILRDAAHVKLLHATSLDQILDQSRRLRSNLSVRVTHTELIDDVTAPSLTTAIIGATYTNRKFRCSVTAPSDSWLIEECVKGDEVVVHMTPSIGSPVEFDVQLLAYSLQQSAEVLLGLRVKALNAMLDGLTIQERGEVLIEGHRMPTIMYSYTHRDDEGTRMRRTVAHGLLALGNRGYLFTFSSPEDQFEAIRPELERVLRNFRLHEDAAQ